MYEGISYLLVKTHPAPKTPKRVEGTNEERRRGYKALFFVILVTTLVLWKVVPLTPYYGYYQTHEYTYRDLLIQIILYFLKS